MPERGQVHDAFDLDQLLDFNGHGVTLLGDFHSFAPGWIATHGHHGFRLNRNAGMTALNGAKRIGKNVVCGHVHRQGIVTESTGYGGKLQTITGIGVGHTMALSQATYLKGGLANWAAGFCVLEVSGSQVTPTLIPMRESGEFIYGSQIWRSAPLLPR